MSRLPFLVAALLAVTWIAPAASLAQQAERESVLGRPRPNFEPLGIELDEALNVVGLVDDKTVANKSSPLASFDLFTRFDLEGSYRTNLYRTQDDPKADELLRILPGFTVRSNWANHEAEFIVNADIGRYWNYDSEDFENLDLALKGRIDITEPWFLRLGTGYTMRQEERGTPDDPGASFAPVIEHTAWVEAETQYFADAVLLRVGVRHSDHSFSGGEPLPQDDRDRTETLLKTRLGYELAPGTTVFVEPRYNFRRYKRSVDFSGFRRDSDGYEVLGGLTWDATAVTFFEAGVGFLRQSYDDSRFDAISGITADARAVWNADEMVTVTASVARNIIETTETGVSGILVTKGGLKVDIEYLDNLIISLGGNYAAERYEGDARRDDIVGLDLLFRYLINEKWFAQMGFSRLRRDSNVPGASFSDNILTLRFGEHL